MLNVLAITKLEVLLSMNWLFDVLENDHILTCELIENDVVTFDELGVTMNEINMLKFIQNKKLSKIFLIEGNTTKH